MWMFPTLSWSNLDLSKNGIPQIHSSSHSPLDCHISDKQSHFRSHFWDLPMVSSEVSESFLQPVPTTGCRRAQGAWSCWVVLIPRRQTCSDGAPCHHARNSWNPSWLRERTALCRSHRTLSSACVETCTYILLFGVYTYVYIYTYIVYIMSWIWVLASTMSSFSNLSKVRWNTLKSQKVHVFQGVACSVATLLRG